MPTVISHSIVGAGIASFFKSENRKKVIIASMLLAALPGLDTILMFILGCDSIFRHREFMHSFFFAAVVALVAAVVFRRKNCVPCHKFWLLFLLFFIVTASHPCLDGFSTGWKYGISFWAPFDNTRYFLWMPPLPLCLFLRQGSFPSADFSYYLLRPGCFGPSASKP